MTLCHKGIDLWLLGYPDAARADVDRALNQAREFQHAATLMYALTYNSIVKALRRDIADEQADELVALADEKGALFWKASGELIKSWLFVLTGHASDAVTSFSSAIPMFRTTGATIFVPLFLSMRGRAFAELRQFDQARRDISEAMALAEASGERWFNAEIYRIAVKSNWAHLNPNILTRSAILSKRYTLLARNRRAPWSFAPHSVLRGYGAVRGGARKPMIYSRAFMTASPRGSTHST